jgi:hypothetical protein
MTPAQFRSEFGYLVEREPIPSIAVPALTAS